jgi:hypothetical protein
MSSDIPRILLPAGAIVGFIVGFPAALTTKLHPRNCHLTLIRYLLFDLLDIGLCGLPLVVMAGSLCGEIP